MFGIAHKRLTPVCKTSIDPQAGSGTGRLQGRRAQGQAAVEVFLQGGLGTRMPFTARGRGGPLSITLLRLCRTCRLEWKVVNCYDVNKLYENSYL